MMANGGSKLMSKKAWKTMHSKPKKSVFSDTPGKVYLRTVEIGVMKSLDLNHELHC